MSLKSLARVALLAKKQSKRNPIEDANALLRNSILKIDLAMLRYLMPATESTKIQLLRTMPTLMPTHNFRCVFLGRKCCHPASEQNTQHELCRFDGEDCAFGMGVFNVPLVGIFKKFVKKRTNLRFMSSATNPTFRRTSKRLVPFSRQFGTFPVNKDPKSTAYELEDGVVVTLETVNENVFKVSYSDSSEELYFVLASGGKNQPTYQILELSDDNKVQEYSIKDASGDRPITASTDDGSSQEQSTSGGDEMDTSSWVTEDFRSEYVGEAYKESSGIDITCENLTNSHAEVSPESENQGLYVLMSKNPNIEQNGVAGFEMVKLSDGTETAVQGKIEAMTVSAEESEKEKNEKNKLDAQGVASRAELLQANEESAVSETAEPEEAEYEYKIQIKEDIADDTVSVETIKENIMDVIKDLSELSMDAKTEHALIESHQQLDIDTDATKMGYAKAADECDAMIENLIQIFNDEKEKFQQKVPLVNSKEQTADAQSQKPFKIVDKKSSNAKSKLKETKNLEEKVPTEKADNPKESAKTAATAEEAKVEIKSEKTQAAPKEQENVEQTTANIAHEQNKPKLSPNVAKMKELLKQQTCESAEVRTKPETMTNNFQKHRSAAQPNETVGSTTGKRLMKSKRVEKEESEKKILKTEDMPPQQTAESSPKNWKTRAAGATCANRQTEIKDTLPGMQNSKQKETNEAKSNVSVKAKNYDLKTEKITKKEENEEKGNEILRNVVKDDKRKWTMIVQKEQTDEILNKTQPKTDTNSNEGLNKNIAMQVQAKEHKKTEQKEEAVKSVEMANVVKEAQAELKLSASKSASVIDQAEEHLSVKVMKARSDMNIPIKQVNRPSRIPRKEIALEMIKQASGRASRPRRKIDTAIPVEMLKAEPQVKEQMSVKGMAAAAAQRSQKMASTNASSQSAKLQSLLSMQQSATVESVNSPPIKELKKIAASAQRNARDGPRKSPTHAKLVKPPVKLENQMKSNTASVQNLVNKMSPISGASTKQTVPNPPQTISRPALTADKATEKQTSPARQQTAAGTLPHKLASIDNNLSQAAIDNKPNTRDVPATNQNVANTERQQDKVMNAKDANTSEVKAASNAQSNMINAKPATHAKMQVNTVNKQTNASNMDKPKPDTKMPETFAEQQKALNKDNEKTVPAKAAEQIRQVDNTVASEMKTTEGAQKKISNEALADIKNQDGLPHAEKGASTNAQTQAATKSHMQSAKVAIEQPSAESKLQQKESAKPKPAAAGGEQQPQVQVPHAPAKQSESTRQQRESVAAKRMESQAKPVVTTTPSARNVEKPLTVDSAKAQAKSGETKDTRADYTSEHGAQKRGMYDATKLLETRAVKPAVAVERGNFQSNTSRLMNLMGSNKSDVQTGVTETGNFATQTNKSDTNATFGSYASTKQATSGNAYGNYNTSRGVAAKSMPVAKLPATKPVGRITKSVNIRSEVVRDRKPVNAIKQMKFTYEDTLSVQSKKEMSAQPNSTGSGTTKTQQPTQRLAIPVYKTEADRPRLRPVMQRTVNKATTETTPQVKRESMSPSPQPAPGISKFANKSGSQLNKSGGNSAYAKVAPGTNKNRKYFSTNAGDLGTFDGVRKLHATASSWKSDELKTIECSEQPLLDESPSPHAELESGKMLKLNDLKHAQQCNENLIQELTKKNVAFLPKEELSEEVEQHPENCESNKEQETHSTRFNKFKTLATLNIEQKMPEVQQTQNNLQHRRQNAVNNVKPIPDFSKESYQVNQADYWPSEESLDTQYSGERPMTRESACVSYTRALNAGKKVFRGGHVLKTHKPVAVPVKKFEDYVKQAREKVNETKRGGDRRKPIIDSKTLLRELTSHMRSDANTKRKIKPIFTAIDCNAGIEAEEPVPQYEDQGDPGTANEYKVEGNMTPHTRESGKLLHKEAAKMDQQTHNYSTLLSASTDTPDSATNNQTENNLPIMTAAKSHKAAQTARKFGLPKIKNVQYPDYVCRNKRIAAVALSATDNEQKDVPSENGDDGAEGENSAKSSPRNSWSYADNLRKRLMEDMSLGLISHSIAYDKQNEKNHSMRQHIAKERHMTQAKTKEKLEVPPTQTPRIRRLIVQPVYNLNPMRKLSDTKLTTTNSKTNLVKDNVILNTSDSLEHTISRLDALSSRINTAPYRRKKSETALPNAEYKQPSAKPAAEPIRLDKKYYTKSRAYENTYAQTWVEYSDAMAGDKTPAVSQEQISARAGALATLGKALQSAKSVGNRMPAKR